METSRGQGGVVQPVRAARGLKGQSSFEYLLTYGWALIVLAAVMGIILVLGVFNPKPVPYCVFPADFNCRGFALNENGSFSLDLGQGTGHTIQVTHLRCTQETNATLGDGDALSPEKIVPNGGHTLLVNWSKECYSNVTGAVAVATGLTGSSFRGKMLMRYTDVESGFQHTAAGDVLFIYEYVPQ